MGLGSCCVYLAGISLPSENAVVVRVKPGRGGAFGAWASTTLRPAASRIVEVLKILFIESLLCRCIRIPRVLLARSFGLDPRGEAFHIDQSALVRTLRDHLFFVERADMKREPAVVHRDQLALERYFHAQRRSGEMPHVHACPNGVESGLEKRQNGVARGELQLTDQVWRTEHARALRPEKIHRDFG